MRQTSHLIVLVLLSLLSALSVASQQPGSFDPTFGSNGVVITPVQVSDTGLGVVVQPDGRIVAVGTSNNGNSEDSDFTIIRYNSDGSLDATFGTGGIVITDVSRDGREDIARAVALQADGKIVVCGPVGPGFAGAATDFGVVRYTSNGTLDTTFGTGGIVVVAIGPEYEQAVAIAIQPDQKIIAAGEADSGNENSRDYALIRLNTNGSLDTSFGGDGIVTTDFRHTYNAIRGVAVQADGKIVGAGHTSIVAPNFVFSAVRYNSDGSLDTSFGDGGEAVALGTRFGTAMALQPDGRVLVTGSRADSSDRVMVRFDTSGILDNTFGMGGIAQAATVISAETVQCWSSRTERYFPLGGDRIRQV
jgi:uncharacterized delta-60 repeat protein